MDTVARTSLGLLAALLCGGCLAASAHADIYWVDSGTQSIGHSGLNQTPVDDDPVWLPSPGTVAGGIAADEAHVYWTGVGGQVWRAAHDGTGVVELVSGLVDPIGLAVDGQYLYITSTTADRIARVPKAGGPVDDDWIATGPGPSSVTVSDTHVFWGNRLDGTIGRATLAGTGVDNHFITGLEDQRGLVAAGEHLFWTDFDAGDIGRANLDGTGVERAYVELDNAIEGNEDEPYGITMVTGSLLWTEQTDTSIDRLGPGGGTSSSMMSAPENPLGITAVGPGWPSDAGDLEVAFGNANVGAGAAGPTRTYSARNIGPYGGAVTPLTINEVPIFQAGAHYTKVVDECSGMVVAPYGSCDVVVRFNAPSTGVPTAFLRYETDGFLSPLLVNLRGRGVNPGTFGASPEPLNAGTVPLGLTGAPVTLTVTNTDTGVDAGTITFPAGGVTLVAAPPPLTPSDPSRFAIADDGCAGVTLAPGETCEVDVTFTPDGGGGRFARLQLVSDAASSPNVVTVYGEGGPPAAPTPDGRPTISGSTRPDGTLTATTGQWGGSPVTGWDYTWWRCNANGSTCEEQEGFDGQEYPLSPSDGGYRIRVTVTASNGGGSGKQRSGLTDTIGLPESTGRPVISGTPEPGSTLTTTNGDWYGNVISYEYQWLRCDARGESCVPVGTNVASYLLANADVGSTIRVRVVATNGSGSAPARSAWTPKVGKLRSTGKPVITGTTRRGHLLSATPGSFAGGPVDYYVYEWWRCSAAGEDCELLSAGADNGTFDLHAGTVGYRMRVRVTAFNAAGEASNRSAFTAVVGS